MAANLRLYEILSATYHSLEESKRDVVGTAIISVAKAGNGLQRAGIWTLTFNTVNPGVSAVCVVASADPHDPSRNSGGVAVLLDGSTVHTNVIEGLGLVFSSGVGFNSSWTSTVYYGAYYDSGAAADRSITRVGQVTAGASSTARRIAVRNDGADLAASAQVVVVNGVRFTHGSGTPFVKLEYTEISQTANFDPGYAITFANKNTTPTPDVVDILVDGSTYDVKRIDTGEAFPGGSAVPMDGATVLEWTSGPLTGLRFVLASSTANSDTATIFVSDGARLVKIAPDVSGSEGTYQAGTTALQLTEDGGLNAGEIGAAATAFFWTKVVTQGSDSPVGNERHWRFVAKGLSV